MYECRGSTLLVCKWYVNTERYYIIGQHISFPLNRHMHGTLIRPNNGATCYRLTPVFIEGGCCAFSDLSSSCSHR